jgi:MinD-like ATPase involved in chromosome partitioning or flagellar assembly
MHEASHMSARSSHRTAVTGGDQAAGLRSLLKRRILRVLPVIGDHDSQGQGACVGQIALGLARCGRSVVLLDAVGTAMAGRGFRPQADLISMIQGEREFNEVAVRCAPGLRAVAAIEGLPALVAADAASTDFFSGFMRLDEPADMVVVNLPAAPPLEGGRWLPLVSDQAEALLVMGAGEKSLTAAYASIKQAAATPREGSAAFRVLVNGADGERDARAACRQLSDTARRFLGATVGYCGNVLRNTRGVAFGNGSAPHAEAARAFARVASEAQGWRLAECMQDETIATPTH